MTHVTTTAQMTIGIDLGDRFSQVRVLDGDGEVLEESRLKTSPDAFRKRFEGCTRSRIALETGTHSPWVTALLKEATRRSSPIRASCG